MNISILLATHRRDETLRRTLESFARLAATELSWEVIVVDNADDDATRELVHSFGGLMSIKHLVERTPGKNSALNTGLPAAEGQLLLFTDDDVIAEPDWLEQMWQGAHRWSDHHVFGGRILPRWPDGVWDLPLPKDDPSLKSSFGVADWGLPEGPFPAGQVWGGNMAVRASVFAGGWRFDPRIGPRGSEYAMGSETEFTTRLERASLGAVHLPRSVVWHQIRRGQLGPAWLFRRSFRAGRGRAMKTGDLSRFPGLLGAPRFVWRQLAETWFRQMTARLTGDRQAALRYGMQHWTWRGYVHQCRLIKPVPDLTPGGDVDT